MSELDSFRRYLSDFRGTLLWALGGSAIVPVLAGLSGFAPPWPNAVVLITAMYVLLAIILSYSFTSNMSKRGLDLSLVVSAVVATAGLIVYLVFLSGNTLSISNGERIALGCGWSADTKAIASSYNLDLDDDCPGDFARILEDRNYESIKVWKPSSVAAAQWKVVIPWLLFFSSFSYFIGAFLRYSSLNALVTKKRR